MTEQEPLVIDSARRYGVTDAAMLHAFRNPVRTFLVDEDMTMLIGADAAGRLLEIGAVESRGEPGLVIVHASPTEVPEEVRMVPRSLEEILAQADDLAAAFEAYEPDADDEGKASSLVSLRIAAARRADADRAVLAAVAEAREHHVSWAAIGDQLGTSGEAARQRYGELVKH